MMGGDDVAVGGGPEGSSPEVNLVVVGVDLLPRT